MIRRLVASSCGLAVLAASFVWPQALASRAEAAVTDWQKGVTVVPRSSSDFGSDDFKRSLRNLRDVGATHVGLVVPYYQTNPYTTDIGRGWNTPTDESLAAAVDYAHSLGLKVMLKPHPESADGTWRAMINPGDRDGWFRNYGSLLLNLARLGDEHGVELLAIGTELAGMASSYVNGDNTRRWLDLIQQVRAVYDGQLTYIANSTNNNGDPYQDEKKSIGFWSALDYAGLSAYYNLNSGGSVAELKGAWNYWNQNDLSAFQRSVGKPLLFGEIGYRSVSGAHYEPWNWQRGGSADQTEQANNYEAFLSYWNDYGEVAGVYWWDWEADPNAGGAGTTSYTPQNKEALKILKRWFAGATPPGGGDGEAANFTASVSAPASALAGASVDVGTSIKATGSLTDGVVDLEIYNSQNQRVFQKFFEGEAFAANQSKNYSAVWTAEAAGEYRLAVGVFSSGWSRNYLWTNDAHKITIGSVAPPPSDSGTVEVWWPTAEAALSGTQPFKAMVSGRSLSDYTMQWQVDNGQLNGMFDSQQDYPHREALVRVSEWRWRGTGPYLLNFVAKDSNGEIIGQKSVPISVP